MGLDILYICDGEVVKDDCWNNTFAIRISGHDCNFREYMEKSVFNVPSDIYSKNIPRFHPDWNEAYHRLLMWLNSSSSRNYWIPYCLMLMKMCADAIYWGEERHDIEWWG